MKYLSKFVITSLLICLGIFNASANIGTAFSLSSDKANVVVLKLEEQSKGPVKVTIMDPNGFTIFTENLMSNQKPHRNYNLENLEEGSYTFQVDYNSFINIQKVYKSFNDVELLTEANKTVFKPSIVYNNGIVGIHLLSFEGSFKIEIYDNEGLELHSEMHQANGSFQAQYDLRNLENGTYNCRVYLNSKNYQGSFDQKLRIDSPTIGL